MQNRNTVLFLVLSMLILGSWLLVMQWLSPPRPHPAVPADTGRVAETSPRKATGKEEAPKKAPEKQPEPPPATAPAEVEGPEHPPITLGNPKTDFLMAVVNPRGAAVTSLWLRDFQAADDDGRPVFENGEKKRLELIPADNNRREGSFLLFDAPANDDRPYSRLGKRRWRVDDVHKREDGTVDRVAFSAQVGPVRVTKIYSLNPGDYHLGMAITLENTTDHDVSFRYHLTGAHGLPIEGKWYTSTLRNAVVGTLDPKGYAARDLQDVRRIAFKGGGEEVRTQNNAIQYAGTTVQYFSSLVVVDEPYDQMNFLIRARPTIQTAVLRGTVTDARDPARLEVTGADRVKSTVIVPPDAELTPAGRAPQAAEAVAIVYHTDDRDRLVADQVYSGAAADRLLFDDITVHLVSDKLELKAHSGPVEHHYLLYNGPVKVRLLAFQEGEQRVNPKLVERYELGLHLNTVTDFHSPGVIGEFSNAIGLTWAIIVFENLMHYVLWVLHVCTQFLPAWLSHGLTILLLTVMVRGLMFPLSRRQALNMIKMQALAPEMKALNEKYKDDPTAKTQAMMELYRKHGMGPLGPAGGCWTIFLQMPIFLGLYYALQESIRFRLAPFLWIVNLAAPDMLLRWGSGIPVISDPANYGAGGLFGMFYLGPYFNLLPVIVAGMMLVQQKMLTPPPADEQQEMQQKMMKFMTVFFALMFYKLAAGLCLYFITSSVWGFAERKLLPKRKPTDGSPPVPRPASNSLFQRAFDRLQAVTAQRPDAAGTIAAAPNTSISANLPAPSDVGKRGKKNRRRDRDRRRNETPRNGSAAAGADGVQADGGWWADARRRVQAWWQQVLRESRKK
jgi:YidC/Oxa1 family membrane protein insertase